MPSRVKTLRASAFQRQNGRCYYCHLPMWIESPRPFVRLYGISIAAASRLRCTAEHLVALGDGGRTNSANVVAACLHCNAARHHRKNPFVSAMAFQKFVWKRMSMDRWHQAALRLALLKVPDRRMT